MRKETAIGRKKTSSSANASSPQGQSSQPLPDNSIVLMGGSELVQAPDPVKALEALQGPWSADNLTSRLWDANLLAEQRPREALPFARALAEALEKSSAHGPLHPDTLASHLLITKILHGLGQIEKAFDEVNANAERLDSPQLLVDHPVLLEIDIWNRYWMASILDRLGEFDKALQEARALAAASEATYPASKYETPVYPFYSASLVNLASRFLAAKILDHLSESESALKEARAGLDAWYRSPVRTVPSEFESGAAHERAVKLLIARILDRLGQHNEALQLARSVLDTLRKSPMNAPPGMRIVGARGPSDPITLGARFLVAKIERAINEPSNNESRAAGTYSHDNKTIARSQLLMPTFADLATGGEVLEDSSIITRGGVRYLPLSLAAWKGRASESSISKWIEKGVKVGRQTIKTYISQETQALYISEESVDRIAERFVKWPSEEPTGTVTLGETNDRSGFLSLPDAGRILGVSKRTMYLWATAGKAPTNKALDVIRCTTSDHFYIREMDVYELRKMVPRAGLQRGRRPQANLQL